MLNEVNFIHIILILSYFIYIINIHYYVNLLRKLSYLIYAI